MLWRALSHICAVRRCDRGATLPRRLVLVPPVAARLITSGTHVLVVRARAGTPGRCLSLLGLIVCSRRRWASGMFGLEGLGHGAAGAESGWDGGEHRHNQHGARYYGKQPPQRWVGVSSGTTAVYSPSPPGMPSTAPVSAGSTCTSHRGFSGRPGRKDFK